MFFLVLSLKLEDLSRFRGTNRYIWTWRSCFCYPFLRKTLILEVNSRKKLPYNKKIHKDCHSLTWMPDLAAFQPSPGRIFHVESEFAVKNARC